MNVFRAIRSFNRCRASAFQFGNASKVAKLSISPTLFRRNMASAMAKRLEGKTIVVTGASSGIGRSTAFEFARTSPNDLKLILTARRIDTLKQVAADINKEVGNGVKIHSVKLDVSNPEEIKGFVNGLPTQFKEIDVLVNNAFVQYSILSVLLCIDIVSVVWSKG